MLYSTTLSTSGSRSGHTNLGRCPEYDHRVASHDIVLHPDYSDMGDDIVPYETFWAPLEAYEDPLDEARGVIYGFTADNEGLSWNDEEKEQIKGAIQHVKTSIHDIIGERSDFRRSALPSRTLEFRQLSMGTDMDEFEARIRHYPRGDVVDAAVTVHIEDFHRTLATHVSSEQDIRERFLFFSRLEGTPFLV